MSLAFTRLVAKRGKGLSAKANSVLRVLADRADTKGRCFPSQACLAEDADLSPRSVFAALKELEATGWIIRERRQRKDGSRTSDLITIRDEEAIARHVEAMLRLPLMAVIAGGKPVDNAVDNGSTYSQGLRLGQLARFATQEEPTTYEESLTYQQGTGPDHAGDDLPQAPRRRA